MKDGLSRLLAALLTVAALPGAAAAAGPPIFPLSQVKPGLRGYGLTVFQGTKPERFDFEVIGIAKNFLPQVDIILVKSDDPKILASGFARGMSGSPLFVDEKVLCAFSYGFLFNKAAIGGCTPIEYMLADAARPRLGPDATAIAAAPWDVDLDRGGAALAALAAPPPPRDGDLVRADVPLVLSGVTPSVFEAMRPIFAPYGLEPLQGGGGAGDPTRGPDRFEMGGAIGVQLARGDVSAVATGTVSYIDGDKVLAFGHPMFGMGEVYLPAVAAEIQVIIPSAMSPFKLASPLRPLGSLVQDRMTSILVEQGRTAEMIPIVVTVRGTEGERVFKSEIARHRFLTPALAMMAISSAAQQAAPDVADVTVALKSRVEVAGRAPLEFLDHAYAPDGANAGTIAQARALRILGPLLFNPFGRVRIERIAVEVDVARKADTADLADLRVPETELPAGEPTYVEAILRPYGGGQRVVRIPLTIPVKYAGATVRIEVVPGDSARIDGAPPESLDDLFAYLAKAQPADTLVATVYLPDEGVTLDGKIIADLPDSALDTIRTGTSTRRGDSYRSIARQVVAERQVVSGKQELVVKIQDEK